ncbi:putative membrane protein [Gottschalkia acidurici 9a]|uniref:Membrane protein n=1 Tax=Gottschalkia acidurici (strain ATCC 7906 / DSM 604 / BCRC 14475 / CIP 104303 / KCTC 5404 / NCIMB 10678 / 9a) TaxID=1128398 RepID=K0B161_GOTA9|nr:DUF116 domain-containing protein [Gottschalkia acidurici]AFS78690.1 putative membrane protein [Gottschalkia acidurici 9a]
MINDKKNFTMAIGIILIVLMTLITLTGMFLIQKDIVTLKAILIIILVTLSLYIISIILSLILLFRVKNEKKIEDYSYKFVKVTMTSIYPLLITVAKLLGKDKDSIRRMHANINNKLVKTKYIKSNRDKILILLPHCLQNDKCAIKITNNIENCKSCGKCDIGDILKLKEKYGINIVVATGGTLAREWIKRIRPKCIIAVACERDLSSGINDVKHIPVMGVLNDRPNGPCFNTKIDVEKIEEAIKLFLKEE